MLRNLSSYSVAILIVNFSTQVKKKNQFHILECCNESVARYVYIWGAEEGGGGGGITRRLPTTCLAQQNCKTRVRRILTSCYHGSKFQDLKRRRETCQLQNRVFMIYLLRK